MDSAPYFLHPEQNRPRSLTGTPGSPWVVGRTALEEITVGFRRLFPPLGCADRRVCLTVVVAVTGREGGHCPWHAEGRQEVPPNINIATICPGEADPKIERTTRNAVLLKNAAIASTRRTLMAFDALRKSAAR